MTLLGESPEDILPDPENPVKGCLRRGIGFCGGFFLLVGFSSLMWGLRAVSPVVGSQYMAQAGIALVIGFILIFIQYRTEGQESDFGMFLLHLVFSIY